jgi:hypothetical protein
LAYDGQKLELWLTAGKSWSFGLRQAKAGAFAYDGQAKAGALAYGGQKLELSLTTGKSWSFGLRRAKAGALAYGGQKAGAFAYKDADERDTCVYLATALRANKGINTIARTVAAILRPRTTSSPVL